MPGPFDAYFGRLFNDGVELDTKNGVNFVGFAITPTTLSDGTLLWRVEVSATPGSNGVPELKSQALTLGTPADILLTGSAGDTFQIVGRVDAESSEVPGTLEVVAVTDAYNGNIIMATLDLSDDNPGESFATVYASGTLVPKIQFLKTGGGTLSVKYSISVLKL